LTEQGSNGGMGWSQNFSGTGLGRPRQDHAAAQCWDNIMQRPRGETEKSKTVN